MIIILERPIYLISFEDELGLESFEDSKQPPLDAIYETVIPKDRQEAVLKMAKDLNMEPFEFDDLLEYRREFK